MAETFTPGPHVVHVQRLDETIGARFSIQSDDPVEVLALVQLHKGTRADLTLWAAAPDLYEALRSVIANWDEFGPEHGLDETIHYARAALSKVSQQQGTPQADGVEGIDV